MYKRVLLKLSGEALSSPENAFEPKVLTALSDELKKVTASGVQVGIVCVLWMQQSDQYHAS